MESITTQASESRAGSALDSPLVSFFFDVDEWVNRESLLEQLEVGDANDWMESVDGSSIRRLVAQLFESCDCSSSVVTGDLRGRLVLLNKDEWLRLGLRVALLPYCGRIRQSMDGHFRRAVRENLDERAIGFLDSHTVAEGLPFFSGGAGAWRRPDRVALGGIRAASEQVCGWSDQLRRRFGLRFSPVERAISPCVGGLNFYWLEIACKSTFPDSHWLWS